MRALYRSIAVGVVGVGDVYDLLVWAKAGPVGPPKAIGNSPYGPASRLVSVDLAREPRSGPNPLLKPVDGIREPDGSIRVHHHVVRGVEVSANE